MRRLIISLERYKSRCFESLFSVFTVVSISASEMAASNNDLCISDISKWEKSSDYRTAAPLLWLVLLFGLKSKRNVFQIDPNTASPLLIITPRMLSTLLTMNMQLSSLAKLCSLQERPKSKFFVNKLRCQCWIAMGLDLGHLRYSLPYSCAAGKLCGIS